MPRKEKFVHLHCHSEFSLLDGAARIPDIVKTAKELGMHTVALTDHGNMYATIKFFTAAKEAHVKPILGCEIYMAPRSRFDKETKEDRSPHHLTLLAKDITGYRNLLKLVSLSSIEGFYAKPRIDRELLKRHKDGLVVLSGCPKGEIPSLIVAGQYAKAREAASWYKELLGDDFYLEIQDLGLPEYSKFNPELIKLGKELGIKLVATNDIHYVKKEDAYAQDVLLCVQTGSFLDEEKKNAP